MNILDGEFQIGWVAEQGKINLEIMRHVFGFSVIGPVVRLGRSPRFQIVVEYNAPDLDETSGANNQFLYNDLYATSSGFGGQDGPNQSSQSGGVIGNIAQGVGDLAQGVGDLLGVNSSTAQQDDTRQGASQRVTKGRYVFGYCKIDAFTTGVMAGRTAVADRIEGLAETWYWRPFTGNEKPVASKITLDNQIQKNYFKAVSGISALEAPSWAYGALGSSSASTSASVEQQVLNDFTAQTFDATGNVVNSAAAGEVTSGG
jgi:hypothetical protein